ncbi:MAG: 50S ribosomal protein L29 [Chloroflexi bacterium]|nr:50S ribosomal protein L29 [Chloroflexota bacterium]MBA3960042.1 50S ribosomal protein L29 [Chloroflexota bacterium]MDQ3407190.1 50S ribosomal protein L29 [Chloroflexota bacterium]
MDIVKARALNDAELEDELSVARRQLYDLRFQLATRQLTDHSQISRTRRSIARLLTVQTERARAAPTTAANVAPAGAGGER